MVDTKNSLRKILTDIRWELQQNRKIGTALLMSQVSTVRADVQSTLARVQYSFEETLDELQSGNKSYARFGDGELRLLLHSNFKIGFQRGSPDLARRLSAVLLSPFTDNDNLLVGLPNYFAGDFHWVTVWAEIWDGFKPLINTKAKYGNAHVTRPFFFDCLGSAGVEMWRKVWDGKDVLIVTGEGSRFELVPELFSGISSHDFLSSLPTNAFDDVNRLLGEIPKRISSDTLVLISLGPAGTVLAGELAKLGCRALDIGHISDSYLYSFKGGAWPETKSVTKS